MLFGFIIYEDSVSEPSRFTEETEVPEDLEHKCFLQCGKQHCRGCYREGVCDWQVSYKYEKTYVDDMLDRRRGKRRLGSF